MASTVRFSIGASKRKRAAPREQVLSGFFAQAVEEDVVDRAPPIKKALLLEDVAAIVKRLKDEGNVLAEAGRFGAAMMRWHEAVGIDDRNATLYELLAQGAMALCQDFQAIQYALKATELVPTWGDAHHTLARCQLNFGELELAQDSILKAIAVMGESDELEADRVEIKRLLDERNRILQQRDCEAEQVHDADSLQVIHCKKHLSLRGQVEQ